jgi:hypothetical protein
LTPLANKIPAYATGNHDPTFAKPASTQEMYKHKRPLFNQTGYGVCTVPINQTGYGVCTVAINQTGYGVCTVAIKHIPVHEVSDVDKHIT